MFFIAPPTCAARPYTKRARSARRVISRLKLQAFEYARRLADLNHAHEQARDKEKDFIGRAEYAMQMRELEKASDL